MALHGGYYMALKYIVTHRVDENNVGDMASNPLQYFLSEDEYMVVDIDKLGTTQLPSGVPIIAGGGGLIENELFGANLFTILQNPDFRNAMLHWQTLIKQGSPVNNQIKSEFFDKVQPLVTEYLEKLKTTTNSPNTAIWGAGVNKEIEDKKNNSVLSLPNWISWFNLIGIRDDPSPYRWVPCASCMHPAFDKTYTETNEFIFFEHKKQLIKPMEFGSFPMPRFTNAGANFEQTIEILGSAKNIITNSYHGVYWGTLLGKTVYCAGNWSSKFFYFRHKPTMIGKTTDLSRHLKKAKPYKNALDECRLATTEFWKEVKNL